MLKLTCPLCRRVVLRFRPAKGAAGSEIEARCTHRKCADRPLITWKVTSVGTVIWSRLDRAPPHLE